MMMRACLAAGAAAASFGLVGQAAGQDLPVAVSLADNIPLIFGEPYDDDQALVIDLAGETVEVVFTTASGDMDAFEYLPDGRYAISTNFNLNTGSQTFLDGDVVAYDPGTGEYEVLLSESRWTPVADVAGFAVTEAGTYLLAIRETGPNAFAASNGPVSIGEGDILEYDPATDEASVFLTSGQIVDLTYADGSAEISGIGVLPGGDLLLTFVNEERIGETLYAEGQIVRFNPQTFEASLYADYRSATEVFSEELDAVAVAPVEAACPADLTGDGAVTAQDLIAYLQAFSGGTGAGEFDGEEGVTVGDLIAFLQAFNAGC